MNEQLQEALAELLGKANNGIDTAGDFLASELPEIIQQLLMWHGVKSAVMFTIGVLIIILSPKILRAVKKLRPAKPTEDNPVGNWFYEKYYGGSSCINEGGVLFCVISAFSAIALFIFSMASINIQWLQIWIAPKVWLIEYAAKLAS